MSIQPDPAQRVEILDGTGKSLGRFVTEEFHNAVAAECEQLRAELEQVKAAWNAEREAYRQSVPPEFLATPNFTAADIAEWDRTGVPFDQVIKGLEEQEASLDSESTRHG